MRNFTQIALIRQFGGKSGPMHDRRAPKGGAKNEQVEYLQEYEESKENPGVSPVDSGALIRL
jgi:hypothetical protein